MKIASSKQPCLVGPYQPPLLLQWLQAKADPHPKQPCTVAKLTSAPSSHSASGSKRNHQTGLQSRSLLALLCLAVAVLFAGGYWFYLHQERDILKEHHDNLHAVAQMKIGQIQAWRQERLADARMNSSGLIRKLTEQWQQTGKAGVLAEIRQRLRFFQENEGYFNMILADVRGRIIVSVEPKDHALEDEELALLHQVAASATPALGDFYHCLSCNRVHLQVAAPVLNSGQQVSAILLLIIDPEKELYPLIDSWPLPHNKAETLLGRKDGESVLVLNHADHRSPSDTVFRQRISADNTASPASLAVLGQRGMYLGADHRGIEVLANLSELPETGWFMATTMETGELRAQLRYRGIGILLLVLSGTFVASILLRLKNLSRQNELSQALLLAEHQQRQIRDEIRTTLYGIGDGVIATDNAGLITRMNRVAERLTGWHEDEALGLPLAAVYQVIHEESGEQVMLPFNREGREGSIVAANNHLLLIARNGVRYPIAHSGAPIRDDAGAMNGVVLVFHDQTKKKAMEKARAESARRYSELIENLNDFIWETGTDGRYSFASSRSMDLLGYPPEELVGKSWLDILNMEDEPREVVERFKTTLANQQPYSQLCRTFVRKDGGQVVLESSATPTFDQHGRFLGYRGVSRDVTLRVKAVKEQQRLQDQLLQAQKMETVGRLAGGVAHDFNNMLTVICGHTEMTLQQLGKNHSLYKRLSEVHQAALHSAALTRQLLAFARKQVIAPRIIDLNETIAGTLKMLHRLIGEHIILGWQPEPDLWLVRMDVTQVGQILTNLAVNTHDAIDGVGHLTIATSNVSVMRQDCAGYPDLAPGDYVQLTVTDDGCGMDQATQAKIFEPFFTTKDDGRGTGLGLATVYGIVNQNGGIIRVDSAPGRGTTFNIILPRVQGAGDPVLARTEVIESRKNETILLVEDEPAILELGTFILKEQGYSVLAVPTPVKAIQLAQEYQGPIDLLLTDVIMPEMNGRDLADTIAESRPTTKVLFMSGYTADMLTPRGVLEPNVQFLEKPFSVDGLTGKVRRVLDHG